MGSLSFICRQKRTFDKGIFHNEENKFTIFKKKNQNMFILDDFRFPSGVILAENLSSIEGRFSPSCRFRYSLINIVIISPIAKQQIIRILAYISELVTLQMS